MKTKMRLSSIATIAIILFLTSFASAEDAAIGRKHVVGRYRITSVHDTLILLDSATGDTWILDDYRDGGKLQWLAITRQEAAVKPPSEASVPAAEANSIELAVEFAPEADAIIVRGNVNDIVEAIEVLQGSNFAPRMTVNFFRDLNFGHIAVKGQRSDVEPIKQLVVKNMH